MGNPLGPILALHAVALVRQPQTLGDVGHAEQLVAGEFHRPDLVLRALVKNEPNDHRLGRRIQELDILDLEVDVALFPVELDQLLLILVELVVLEDAAAGDPGKHPVLARLDGLAEFLDGKGFGANKVHLEDLDLGSLRDLEGGGAAARVLVNVQHVFDLGARIPLLLVQLLDVLGVGEQLAFIQRLIRPSTRSS